MFYYISDFTRTYILQVVNESADVQCPVVEMSTRSKLSCLSWNKYTKNHLASSDYEGIVTVWDVNTRQVISLSNHEYIFCLCKCFKFVAAWSCEFSCRVWWNMRNMRKERGVLIFLKQSLQCLCLGVMTARYICPFFKIFN